MLVVGKPEMVSSRSTSHQRTLAILVTTSRYPEYIVQIAKTAHEKGISIYVHYSGQGVILAEGNHPRQLDGIAAISICRDSCDEMGLTENPYASCFVPSDRMIELIQTCTRIVVF